MVEKLSKEIEKETKKRENAVREKNETNEKLKVYESVFDELRIEDPVKFMQDFVILQNDFDELNS